MRTIFRLCERTLTARASPKTKNTARRAEDRLVNGGLPIRTGYRRRRGRFRGEAGDWVMGGSGSFRNSSVPGGGDGFGGADFL
jgi:hypothetical protein